MRNIKQIFPGVKHEKVACYDSLVIWEGQVWHMMTPQLVQDWLEKLDQTLKCITGIYFNTKFGTADTEKEAMD